MDTTARSRVLIAHQDADTRLYLQRVLSGAYEVQAVSDGEAALTSARESPPDLLLADVLMAQFDGFGLLRALRADPPAGDIPVILLSASANEDSRLDAIKAGAADYLIESFSAPDLLARIDARLEIARLRRQFSDLERKVRASAEVADAEFPRKNNRLRRARNSLQRELSSRTEEVAQLNRELIAERRSLLSLKDEMAGDLKAMNQLHEFNGRLLDPTEIERLLKEVLDASMAMLNADFGHVQLYDPQSRALKIVAQCGFKKDFLDYLDHVPEGTASSVAALERRECIIVEDVLTERILAPHLPIVNAAGYRAVLSMPLIGRGGEMLGMISTHFREPHRPSERELRLADLYARQATEMIERKRAAAELHASEERFRRYFELGLIGMAMTSQTKGIFEVNDELCRILGYECEELLQKTWAEMTHPDDLAADIAQFNRIMAGEIDGYTLDKRWVRKDGAIIDSIMSAQCVRRADGSVHYFVGLLLDTTKRKRAENNLRRSEANLAEAQRLCHTGSWAWNASSEEMFCSDELLRIFGQDEAANSPCLDDFLQMIHPEDQSRIGQTLDHAMRSGADYEAEYRIVRRDGSIRDIHNLAHPVFDDRGTLFEYVGTVMDITDRKYAELALRRSEANLAEGQRISHTGSWSMNPSTEEIYCSRELLRIFGVDTDTAMRSRDSFMRFIDAEDRTRVQQAFDHAVRTQSKYEDEFRIVGSDGAIKHIHCLAHPVFQQSGEVTEYVGTIVDISERKRTEEELQKAQAELARVSRFTMMGELAASIAHEINQPLGSIVNNGNVAMQIATLENPSPDKLVEVLSDIIADANRTSAIIARIRAVMKKSAPEKTVVQLKDVVADVIAVAHRELTERQVTVRIEIPDDLPSILGDRVQLQQVLLNLVMNAMDAMTDLGTAPRILTIDGRRDELAGNPAVRLAVQDNGVGFQGQDGERLFDAFFTSKADGMGMGLCISRSIVEAHGGRLWATSGSKEGATFYCALPIDT